MKKIFFIQFLLIVGLMTAQVGINTANPVNTLDINGDLNVRKELRTAGTDILKGSAGNAGDIFHNNSEMAANDWKNIKIADGQGSMSLFSINTTSDQTGVSFTGNGSAVPYNDGDSINGWSVLPGNSDTFSVTNANNKVTFSFQTTVQKTETDAASFACGVFVDDLLRAVRTDVLLGEKGAYKIFNLNATLANLTPKNKYAVKVACIKRTISTNTLGIGRAVETTFLNGDMSQSVLTISVLQPY
ncbi:hypothetical protein H3Z85_09025 [Chryseobacterium indologenes]|uniref:Uncharacterized protein n=1 Tax=Chryseobacterium indologenes TaxID=253 RepID=A0A5R9PX25_CHRID|nr:hypothetical protein [Chryseobacterium indologenes]AZB19256.1 hypothetical protein EG352_16475 [Chryseobacterium indologenes]QPQ53445.1 hypothetical protein H3Z85_09025 [Chryseobacterium indologenes]TLX27180.1 hypothetical protein FE904_01995 [Chryseobacterium indologenes]SFJ57745.1 hypothetical protein SAMN05421692_2027 [Chryseobacterium indologenes]SUX52306.1 Uncharacterised protein [Chryseobacterium indologenes]